MYTRIRGLRQLTEPVGSADGALNDSQEGEDNPVLDHRSVLVAIMVSRVCMMRRGCAGHFINPRNCDREGDRIM